MTVPLLGIVTIGQSPRPDLVSAFAAFAPGARVEVRGALDGMATDAIDALARRDTDYPLLVRLTDGSTRADWPRRTPPARGRCRAAPCG